jgi:hypothetical protein
MRKLLLLFTVMALFEFVSCSKKNAGSNSTTWTYNNNSYTTTTAGYDSSGLLGSLGAQDAAGNGIGVVFNAHPKENGTYILSNGYLGVGYPTNYCTLSVISNNAPIYISIGKPGDVVNVTISNGKLHASFSNISIGNGKDTTTVSGTIIQVTYE